MSLEQILIWMRHILKTHDIEVLEIDGNEESPCYFYAHLKLKNGIESMPLIFNGRGLTKTEALVGAYGELLERLQTMHIFETRFPLTPLYGDNVEQETYKIPFTFAPDEVTIQKEKHTEIDLPFYHLNTNKIESLPYRLIEFRCGSNGCASGSTIQDATLRAWLELLERYALRMLYCYRLTPPTISSCTFEKDEELIAVENFCEQKNLKLIIKDCSCGLSLPVIGVLLQNQTDSSYFFSLAAATNARHALNRALTEAFQGERWKHMQPYDTFQMNLIEHNDIDNDNARVAYSEGRHSLYTSFFNAQPTYAPMQWIPKWAKSIDEGILMCKNIFHRLNKQVYIRDVSYLGFPTVITYIPTMSEIIDFNGDRWYRHSFGLKDKIALLNHQIPSLSCQQIEELLEAQAQYNQPISLPWFTNHDIFSYANNAIIYYLLALSVKRLDLAEHFANITNMRTTESVTREKLLQMFPFANCFHCSHCIFRTSCAIEPYSYFITHLFELYTNNLPNQMQLQCLR